MRLNWKQGAALAIWHFGSLSSTVSVHDGYARGDDDMEPRRHSDGSFFIAVRRVVSFIILHSTIQVAELISGLIDSHHSRSWLAITRHPSRNIFHKSSCAPISFNIVSTPSSESSLRPAYFFINTFWLGSPPYLFFMRHHGSTSGSISRRPTQLDAGSLDRRSHAWILIPYFNTSISLETFAA